MGNLTHILLESMLICLQRFSQFENTQIPLLIKAQRYFDVHWWKHKAFQKITGKSLGHHWPIPFSLIKWIWGPFQGCIDRVFKMTGDLQISSQASVSRRSTEHLSMVPPELKQTLMDKTFSWLFRTRRFPRLDWPFLLGFCCRCCCLGIFNELLLITCLA